MALTPDTDRDVTDANVYVDEALRFISQMDNAALHDVLFVLEELQRSLEAHPEFRSIAEDVAGIVEEFTDEILARVRVRGDEASSLTDRLLDIRPS